jgi:hypothetical protein
MANKTWATNGKGREMNDLASKWATGQNYDKKIKPVHHLIKKYESITVIHKNMLYTVQHVNNTNVKFLEWDLQIMLRFSTFPILCSKTETLTLSSGS